MLAKYFENIPVSGKKIHNLFMDFFIILNMIIIIKFWNLFVIGGLSLIGPGLKVKPGPKTDTP